MGYKVIGCCNRFYIFSQVGSPRSSSLVVVVVVEGASRNILSPSTRLVMGYKITQASKLIDLPLSHDAMLRKVVATTS